MLCKHFVFIFFVMTWGVVQLYIYCVVMMKLHYFLPVMWKIMWENLCCIWCQTLKTKMLWLTTPISRPFMIRGVCGHCFSWSGPPLVLTLENHLTLNHSGNNTKMKPASCRPFSMLTLDWKYVRNGAIGQYHFTLNDSTKTTIRALRSPTVRKL